MKLNKCVLLLALGLSLSSCANATNKDVKEENNSQTQAQMDTEKTKDEEIQNKENEEEKVIYASFYPIYNLTKQIAGDKFTVESFTSLKTESHGFEPSAKDIADLSKAHLIFINGAGMEEWEESLENSSDIEIVNTSENVELLKGDHHHHHDHEEMEEHDHEGMEDHEDMEEHDHEEMEDHDHEDMDNHDHEEMEEHDHEHSHGEFDPHTWLSPKNAISQAKVIADKLAEVDPANKDYYMKNYEKIEKELQDMIDEYQGKFAEVGNKNFLVSHKAFSYLANDFGLNQLALTSLTSTEDADAKTLKEAVDKAKELGINTIFYEMGGSDKSAKTIANEMDAKTVPLNTLEFATDEMINSDTSYQDLIKYNLEELYKSMAD